MKRREFLKSALLTAAAGAEWSKLGWSQQVSATRKPEDVKHVLVVSKCHLDIGFTDTQANVMRTYFEQYYPQAIATAARLREAAGKNRYIWTTGSWLLYEYLEQANSEQRRRMDQAIAANDIAWHALPFSWQTELLDRSMIEGSLGFCSALDARFGRKTIAGKMTDVPGHSRGLVPPLAAHGIQLLDVGVNPASTPPDVPDVFVWAAPGGASMAVLYHKHNYGGVVQVPDSDLVIAVEVRVDNTGPHTEQEIDEIYKGLHQQFPNAEVIPASLSDVALALQPVLPKLPVFSEEIGDTWIYGAPSDPPKIARFREMARLRQEWLRDGRLSIGDTTDCQLLRRLTLAAEHTWGTDTKRYIDHDHYSPKELAANIDKPGYRVMERSWQEKRDDIDVGVSNLPQALRLEARERLESLHVAAPITVNMKLASVNHPIHTTRFELMIDPATGSIIKLDDLRTGRSWASAGNPLALFTYQTLTQADYTRFLNAYVLSKEWWAPQDFGKPNIERFQAQSRDWHPSLKRLWSSEHATSHRVVAELAIEDAVAEQSGLVAWPEQMFLELEFPKAESTVQCTFYALKKAPNRMPEALWLSFVPDVSSAAAWSMDKVDQDVRVADVVRGGGRTMHAVTSRIGCREERRRFDVTTLDAPVVALGARSPLNFSEDLPDLKQGIHFSLFNNAWGTNYPQWAGGDWRFRFTLRV